MNDLRSKLLGSAALQATAAESRVAVGCSVAGWNTVRSAYFTDAAHNRLREIDVSASSRWSARPPYEADSTLNATLTFLIEVKSMVGFHLVFDAISTPNFLSFQTVGYCGWPGYLDPERKLRIADLLRRHDYEARGIVPLIDKLSAVAYPDDSVRAGQFLIEPPMYKNNAGSFKETNIGAEKDLDNSVLWRACLSLRSAIDACVAENFDGFLEDFETDVFLFRQQNDETWLTGAMTSHSSSVALFHPVVVTGAHLWQAANDGLHEVQSVRLVIRNHRGHVKSWFDVVQESAFANWFKVQSDYYSHAFTLACQSMTPN